MIEHQGDGRTQWAASALNDKTYDLLDEVAKIARELDFPADFIANGAAFVHGGTTINGRSAPFWPASPASDDERY